MLIISDLPLGLVKYHVTKNLEKDIVLKIEYITNIKEVEDILLEGVSYNKEGELCQTVYIILYSGDNTLNINYTQSKNNTTYLLVKNVSTYKKFFTSKKAIKLNLTAQQYKHEISFVEGLLTKEAFDYFWSEYCINKFNSNPFKWQLEVRHLLFLFKENKNMLLTIQDLDRIYRNVSDRSNNYLKYMFTEKSFLYLKQLKPEDYFLLFIKGHNMKAPVLKNIELNKPIFLFVYMCFKESFYKGYIRLSEGVFILNYIINSSQSIDYLTVQKLFKLI